MENPPCFSKEPNKGEYPLAEVFKHFWLIFWLFSVSFSKKNAASFSKILMVFIDSERPWLSDESPQSAQKVRSALHVAMFFYKDYMDEFGA